MRQIITFFCVLISLAFAACQFNSSNQINDTYHINQEIVESISSKLKPLKGVTMSTMDFSLFENDKLIADSDSIGKPIESLLITSLHGDTILIAGFMGMFSGFGYQIELNKDRCSIHHFVSSDAKIYKLKTTDSLAYGISVPCKSSKLTLIEKPIFKKGEIVSGIIELKSEEYYEVTNGEENIYRAELTGYFKTEPLKILD